MENPKMTFMLTYIVYGEPVGKGRPRFARRGNFVSTYTPEKTKTYEDEIRMMARAAMGRSEPLETPVTVALYIRVEIPAAFPKQFVFPTPRAQWPRGLEAATHSMGRSAAQTSRRSPFQLWQDFCPDFQS